MRAKRRKLKRKAPFIISCLVILALLAGGCVLAKNKFFGGEGAGSGSVAQAAVEGKRLNVLLMGIDARGGETMARSDTMILASVDPKTKQMVLLSIPRDSRVNIPGHGWDRINTAVVYGGPELAMRVVADLTGVPVKYYVLTDFRGFKEIVDILGGVTLEVEQDMYHWDDEEGGIYEINLKKGLQRLDGDKALQYVRYRDYDLGDIDRTRHQQKFLVALAKEVLQPSTVPKLPKLIPEVYKWVKTNMGLSDMYTLAAAAKNFEEGKILTQTLPGYPGEVDGVSYWLVDPSEARRVVASLLKGDVTAEVVLNAPPPSVYASSYYGGSSGVSGGASSSGSSGAPPGKKDAAGDKSGKGAGQQTQAAPESAKSSNGSKSGTAAGTKPAKETSSDSGGTSASGSSGTGVTVKITPLEEKSEEMQDPDAGSAAGASTGRASGETGGPSSSAGSSPGGVNPVIPPMKTTF